MNETPLISVEDLSVDFRSGERVTHAVKHVSFDIGHAETVALVGEFGSGKTVTALSILKLLPYPSASHPSGKILFNGANLLSLPQAALAQDQGQQDLHDLPGADDLAQPAAHHREPGRRGAEDPPRAVGPGGARAGARPARGRSASTIRKGGSNPIRISSRAVSGRE